MDEVYKYGLMGRGMMDFGIMDSRLVMVGLSISKMKKKPKILNRN